MSCTADRNARALERGVDDSLDPGDWTAARALAHRMIDDMIDHLSNVRERARWRPLPPEVRGGFRQPLPWAGAGEEATYDEFRDRVLPYPTGNMHPRFWGWVASSGSLYGSLASFLAAAMNPALIGFQQAPELVEREVIGWIRSLIGFPETASGIMVSGGSVANFVALAAARNAAAAGNVNGDGLRAESALMTFYGSSETHSSVRKALQLLGLGTECMRSIPVDRDYRIDLAHLQDSIERDRADGHRPAAIIGNAGTVDQGAFDDLDALAEIAGARGMWFHVDGAFGATVVISDRLRDLARGLDRADSLTLDFHKWFSVPYGAACVVMRDPAAHRDPFSFRASYFSTLSAGTSATDLRPAEYGLELTREFRALKVWMCLKAFGLSRLARLVERNVEQARSVKSLIEAQPALELVAPVPLNVVCFRYVDPRLDQGALNRLNERIIVTLQEQGIAVPSHTMNVGRLVIRLAICNHRSTNEDFECFIREVVRIGGELAADAASGDRPPAECPHATR